MAGASQNGSVSNKGGLHRAKRTDRVVLTPASSLATLHFTRVPRSARRAIKHRQMVRVTHLGGNPLDLGKPEAWIADELP
jgi:hypothetical protein